ncbi:MAG TPA: CE1759 family FMN reductase [Actinospica sp.]|jgi:FMN reductase|nr:CE1759 family FMN reductase [Actinospica sp.]
MDPLKLVVVSAGLGKPSATRMLADRLAEATGRGLREQHRAVHVRVLELRELAVDIANNLVTGFPNATLADALLAVERADGLIVVSPIFSASYSGLFKSFFDVLPHRSLTGKPVLIAATGGTSRHSLALDHALRPLFSFLAAIVVPTGVYAATEDWGAPSGAGAASLAGRIDRAAAELTALLAALPSASARTAAPAPGGHRNAGTDASAGAVGADGGIEESVVPFEQLLARVTD